MKVLVDTNILLDVLLSRADFFCDSRLIFEFVEQKRITGCISASAITDIFYIVKKEIKNTEAIYSVIEKLTAIFSVAPVSETTIANSLALRWKDFEDAVQFMVAKENGAAYIITRNKADYESSDIPCMSPAEFVTFL